MKKIVETIVGGTIGLIALYIVAHVAYDAGHKMAEAECRYEKLTSEGKSEEEPTPEALPEESPAKKVRKINRFGFAAGIGKILSNGKSVLGRIIQNPDDQKIEMYVDGELLRVDVKPRK